MNVNLHRGFALAVTYWVVVIIVAHFFAPPGYVWTQNTISELASQGHMHKWIMQVGLIGFGALVVLAVGQTVFKAKKLVYPVLPVALYGFAILLAGIYCAAPIDQSLTNSDAEAKLHSLFATLSGLSLSLAILWRILVSSKPRERLVHAVFLVAVIGLLALFGLAENTSIDIGIGVIQRLLYLSGFSWLIFQELMLPADSAVLDKS